MRRHPLVAGLLSLVAPGLGQLYAVRHARALAAAGVVVGIDIGVVAALAFVAPSRWASVAFLAALVAVEIAARLLIVADAAREARRNRTVSPGRYNRPAVYLAFFAGVGLLQVAPGALVASTIGFKTEIYAMGSPSGYPNVRSGDYVAVWKDYYRRHAPRRGELAAFEARAIRSDRYEPSAGFYRIVGLPGDDIRYDDGRVTINGRPATVQPEGAIDYPLGKDTVKRALVFAETLPDGTRYRIAQNPEDLWFWQRGTSFTVPPGHLFLLGDNRTAAYDSRFERFVTKEGAAPSAYVPIENLRGRVMFVLVGRSFDRIGQSLDPHR